MELMLGIFFMVAVTCQAQGPNIISRMDTSLPRLDPVRVGYEREVIQFQLSGERANKVIVKTVSVKPPIFTIEDFITEAECKHIIMYAKRLGLEKSPLTKDSVVIEDETSMRTFKKWDWDGDGYIEPAEVSSLPGKGDLYLTEDDVLDMFKELDMDQDKDGRISFDEFWRIGVTNIKNHFDKLRKVPHLRSRHSEQAWMFHDNPKYPLLADLHGRLSRLTGLPKYMIRNSEPIQVVKYKEHGHYHAHHDSDELNATLPCCSFHKEENCRLCRYMTVLFFLNEPEEGGQTAFPYANNDTFTEEGLRRERRKVNLARHCKDANVVIKPKRGMAVMWYNHEREPSSGWLGKLDRRTYHGGCDVIKGEKWIANAWLNVIGEINSDESFKGWLHSYEGEDGLIAENMQTERTLQGPPGKEGEEIKGETGKTSSKQQESGTAGVQEGKSREDL